MTKQELFRQLWDDYTQHTPEAQRIHDLFANEGETVQNDHIALRTANLPRIDTEVLAQVFKDVGYVEQQSYQFPEKNLTAKHYAHESDANAPLVFISQLEFGHLRSITHRLFKDLVARIPENILQPRKLITAGNPWGTPSYETYTSLLPESEYAAWLYVFGFRANHFTVSVNALKKYDTIEKVNEFLKANGYSLNTSGGEVKGSEELMLKQSSTLAAKQAVRFQEGTYEIPTCYYEFAQRFPDTNGELFRGFIANSANKIFESTDSRG